MSVSDTLTPAVASARVGTLGTQRPGDAADPAHADLLRWMTRVGSGVVMARFCGFDEADRFLVQRDGDAAPTPAVSTLALRDADLGCRVVVAFEEGDVRRPIILGRLQARSGPADVPAAPDDDRLRLTASRAIELRCGEASLVLTRAGKVLINGTYVLSRSKGANRIKGAYVDIN